MSTQKFLSPDFLEGLKTGIVLMMINSNDTPISETEAASLCGLTGSTRAAQFRSKYVFCDNPQISPIMIGQIPGKKKYHRKYYKNEVLALVKRNQVTIIGRTKCREWVTNQPQNQEKKRRRISE